MVRSSAVALLLLAAACDGGVEAPPGPPEVLPDLAHTTTIAIDADGRLWVVRPDADAVAVLEQDGRSLRTVSLGPTPSVDEEGRYAPAVRPRSLAILGDRVLVAAERSGEVIAIDRRALAVVQRRPVCARPIGVLATREGVLLTCAADAEVRLLAPDTLHTRVRVSTPPLPWALALDGQRHVAQLACLHGPVLTVALPSLEVGDVVSVDLPSRGDRLLSHGLGRALYDLAWRPDADELWIAHELHAADTPSFERDFESAVFPAISVESGGAVRAISVDSRRVGPDGSIGDVISGPRALAFTPNGNFALVVAQASEDLVVLDADRRVEVDIVRPLPGDWPQGIALSPAGDRAFVDMRNSGTVVRLSLRRDAERIEVVVDGEPLVAREADPMPPELRLGQRVFHTSNSAEIPVTTNHWLACASCHTEGSTDRVAWPFAHGLRDTMALGGGPVGLQHRTAERLATTDVWRTIRSEQGGQFLPDDEVQRPWLMALAAFVERAIPVPPPPATDEERAGRGRAVFERTDVGCVECHTGPALSDSGEGHPGLEPGAQPVAVLHDVGTCATEGSQPDLVHRAVDGTLRQACAFDTPSLRGLADSAPYLHDGSAATLVDVLTRNNPADRHGRTAHLSDGEIDDLVEYLRGL